MSDPHPRPADSPPSGPAPPAPPFERLPHILEDEEGEGWHFHVPWIVFTDAHAEAYRARRRRRRTALLLWLVGGWAGAHLVYCGHRYTGSVLRGHRAVVPPVLFALGWLVDPLFLVALGGVLLFDLTVISARVEAWNLRLASQIGIVVPY